MDWQKFLAFFCLSGAFYSKMFKWGRQGGRTIPSLSEDLLFLFPNCKTHFQLVQICVCVRLFIWGRQILCILKGLKSFQNNHCHKKKITVCWNHFLYVIIPQCGNVCSSERWWGDRRIKTGNLAVQCSHCGLVTVATKTIIFNSVSYM